MILARQAQPMNLRTNCAADVHSRCMPTINQVRSRPQGRNIGASFFRNAGLEDQSSSNISYATCVHSVEVWLCRSTCTVHTAVQKAKDDSRTVPATLISDIRSTTSLVECGQTVKVQGPSTRMTTSAKTYTRGTKICTHGKKAEVGTLDAGGMKSTSLDSHFRREDM
ncbi:hypothetical protein AB1N83_001923 [Pleurotus pulmonarius]